jgi:hypothetical protein
VRFPAVLFSAAGLALATRLVYSDVSRLGVHQGYEPDQPIIFPHRIHAGDNKIACLYCHSAARTSRHAGIPSASVCMNCHNLLEKQTVEIERMKEAVQLGRPIAWVKVHNLPDYVYFNHSQHVVSGVACQRCHGAVEQMDRVAQTSPLTMGWCLDCHRSNGHLPSSGLRRAVQGLDQHPKPVAGLDCGSCHY